MSDLEIAAQLVRQYNWETYFNLKEHGPVVALGYQCSREVVREHDLQQILQDMRRVA